MTENYVEKWANLKFKSLLISNYNMENNLTLLEWENDLIFIFDLFGII
jgi:hypothetical protein